jgi:hypothetical protein
MPGFDGTLARAFIGGRFIARQSASASASAGRSSAAAVACALSASPSWCRQHAAERRDEWDKRSASPCQQMNRNIVLYIIKFE